MLVSVTGFCFMPSERTKHILYFHSNSMSIHNQCVSISTEALLVVLPAMQGFQG